MLRPLLEGARPDEPFYFDRFDIFLMYLFKEEVVRRTVSGRRFRAYIDEADHADDDLLIPATTTDLLGRLEQARIIIVGEHHPITTTRAVNHQLFERLVKGSSRVALGLEALPHYAQGLADEYVWGRLGLKGLKEKITSHRLYRESAEGVFDLEEYKGFLKTAKRTKSPLLCFDRHGESCEGRDRRTAAFIAGRHAERPDEKAFYLIGTYHAVPAHLPRLLQEEHGVPSRDLCVLVNDHEATYRATRASPGRLFQDARHSHLFSALTATPMEIVRSYLQTEAYLPEEIIEDESCLSMAIRNAFVRHFGLRGKKGTVPERRIATEFRGDLWDLVEKRPLREEDTSYQGRVILHRIPGADYSRSFYHCGHDYLFLRPNDALHAQVFFDDESLRDFMTYEFPKAS